MKTPRILTGDPPDWQNQKLILARQIVKELKKNNKLLVRQLLILEKWDKIFEE